jgi:hypothetical protein
VGGGVGGHGCEGCVVRFVVAWVGGEGEIW